MAGAARAVDLHLDRLAELEAATGARVDQRAEVDADVERQSLVRPVGELCG